VSYGYANARRRVVRFCARRVSLLPDRAPDAGVRLAAPGARCLPRHQMAAQLYRGSTVGSALTDALDEMARCASHAECARLRAPPAAPETLTGTRR
jgi:hypothetical protein